MGKSTSSHTLNADRGLSRSGRIAWFAFNWLNNLFPFRDIDPHLEMTTFIAENSVGYWDKISPTASPSRRLSNLFWYSLPWHEIAVELEGRVNAIEVGCGSGYYGTLLKEYLGDALVQYVGLDMKRHPAWEQHQANSTFHLIQTDSSSTFQHLTGANLIITQSALEHFDEDHIYFRQIAEYVEATLKPIIQVHLMPSAACIYTYPWHGVRQYTPRTLSNATRLFGVETKKTLIALGSAQCNRIHRQYVAKPIFGRKIDLRETQTEAYVNDLHAAIQHDQRYPVRDEACFYALVLQSRVKNPITLSVSY